MTSPRHIETDIARLRDELRLIGCHKNGAARCTCVIGQDALGVIDALRARVEALEGALRERDGGTHDEDCRWHHHWRQNRYCNCGHDRARAVLGGDT